MAVVAGHDQRWICSSRGLAAIVDFATRSHLRAVLVLIVAVLLNVLPGFCTVPPTDRDESRFAQATKQMVESGDYVDIRFQNETRYKKPVGIYWLQAAAVHAGRALGVTEAQTAIWLYRIPSLLGAIGAVLLTYWAALAFVSRRAAVLAGLMMATCIVLSVEGRLAKTDAVLLLTAVAAMGALARTYLHHQRGQRDAASSWQVAAIFWTALAGSILLKGAVVPLLIALAIGTLVIVDRSARWLLALRPIPGVILCVALALPWFLAIVMRSGDAFFAESVGQDLLSKLFRGQETHGAPPGYYFSLFWATFFPGATLAGLAAPAVWAERREAGTKFLLAWIVPAWIMCEIVVTKLPHYVLPLYPAIAILIAGVVDAKLLVRGRWVERGTIWWLVVPLLLGIGGLAALHFLGQGTGLPAWPVIAAAVIAGWAAWHFYNANNAEHSLLRAAVATVLITSALLGLIAPSLARLFPSMSLAKILRDSGCGSPAAASAGYHEPSLVFLAGTGTRLTDGTGAAEFLRGGECRFAFVDAREQPSFIKRAEQVGLAYSRGPQIEAFNLGDGRMLTISVYRSGETR